MIHILDNMSVWSWHAIVYARARAHHTPPANADCCEYGMPVPREISHLYTFFFLTSFIALRGQ